MARLKIPGKVVVTGAGGFLGRHLFRALRDIGTDVVGCDNSLEFAEFARRTRGGARLIQCDITQKDRLGFLRDADVVFHLAAIANPRTCGESFDLAYDVNVTGTKNVLDACRDGCLVVFLSAGMAYGEPLYLPFDEGHPLRAVDPYSVTKIMGEQLCHLYERIRGLRIVVVRNFSTYGPGQSADYVVPSLISEAMTKGRINVRNASTTRDFTYVDDAVDALLAIARSEKLVGEPVNLGSGEEVSIGMLARVVSEVLGGVPVTEMREPEAAGGRQVCSNARLRNATGWHPKVSLRDGVMRTAVHLKDRCHSI